MSGNEITIPLLEADDIEVRIQQACKGNKALALLYKTSRTDMRILDNVFGVYGWKDEYKEIKGNLYCGISIYDKEKQEWITKWDCGIESQQEDGNERKAEASDATKRCAVKIGIGRELYSAPMIFINTATEVVGKTPKGKDKYGLVNPYEKYKVSYITYNEKREIASLEIVDSKGNVVYQFNCGKQKEEPKPSVPQMSKAKRIQELIKGTEVTAEQIREYNETNFGIGVKVNDLTNEQFNKLYTAISKFINGEE